MTNACAKFNIVIHCIAALFFASENFKDDNRWIDAN
jgi:hypothetical protein